MNGLSTVHVELTSRCNKSCFCCGRRKIEKEYPHLANWGDIEMEVLYELYNQIPKDITVQVHNNGEPLLYPHLYEVLEMFNGNIRCFNTNGKLLLEKANEIIDNLEVLTISVIENDQEGDQQYDTVRKFIERKHSRKPLIVYRLLGKVDNEFRWKGLPGIIATRVLHSPYGSRAYQKTPTIPETGICQDLLTHCAIDRFGNISLCVRFDPEGNLRLGNIKEVSLEETWSSQKRKEYIAYHIEGRRNELSGCRECDYWGCPTSQ